MNETADARFASAANELVFSCEGGMKIGGDYVPVMFDGNVAYVSGQVPRIGSDIVVVGSVGAAVSLTEARRAAQICALRALAFLQRELGSLDRVRQVLKVSVFTQSAPGFTQQSEVADAASALLHRVLGEAGRHARTSVGVFQLPKNASVELDLVASIRP